MPASNAGTSEDPSPANACAAAGLLVAPRFTRWLAAVFTVLFAADLLQVAYKKAVGAL